MTKKKAATSVAKKSGSGGSSVASGRAMNSARRSETTSRNASVGESARVKEANLALQGTPVKRGAVTTAMRAGRRAKSTQSSVTTPNSGATLIEAPVSGLTPGRSAGLKFKKTSSGTEIVAKSQTSKDLLAPRVAEEKLYGEVAIEEAQLERFPNRTHVRRYTIDFTCPEFTCVCPRSGFPDFATIRIKYVPDQYCVELKSLKLYINTFRNKKVFHEDVTNSIIQDMIDLLDPHYIEVVGDFTVRGNIHTVITAEHTK